MTARYCILAVFVRFLKADVNLWFKEKHEKVEVTVISSQIL